MEQLPANWRRWVAENGLRDCDPASMVNTMVEAGVDEQLAATGVEQVLNDPVFSAARLHQQLQKKYASIMLNHQKMLEQNPNFAEIERRDNLSKDEFFEKYYLGNRPVIVTDFTQGWPALSRWSPAYFKEKFGHVNVEVQMGREKKALYEENKHEHKRYLSMKNLVERIEALDSSNDIYMTANNDALKNFDLKDLFDDIGDVPVYLDESRLHLDTSLWFGPAGTVTPLHHDPVHLFHAQIVGRKRWRFIPAMQTPLLYNFNSVFSPIDIDNPDLDRYPLFKDATILDVTVQPGEAIFLPLAWWHHVVSLDTCISLSFGNIAYNNIYEYENPTIRHWY